MTILTQRMPKRARDFRRVCGTGPGRNGTLSPDAAETYARSEGRGPWRPLLSDITLLHRYLEPNPRIESPTHEGMREFLGRKYRVSRRWALISVADWEQRWKVSYYATGSPDGWNYRFFGARGDAAAYALTMVEIRTLVERSASFPEELRLPRWTRKRFTEAKAWCAANCEPEAWLYFEGKFRFRDAAAATMFKIVWS